MKKKLIRKISIIMMAFTIAAIIPISASAAYTDVPKDASYADAVSHLTSLGAIAGTGSFSPNSPLTREQYARIICAAAGLDDLAASMKNSSEFPDVPASLWSSGYINAAVAKGYITGGVDGKFHPTQAVTFLQLSSFLVRALGYANTDLTGTWPDNYISKAYDLGLTDGISLKNDTGVPRWAAALMIDRFLTTDVKPSATSTTAKTFLESTGYYTKAIVFGDWTTNASLLKGQVLTDKGTYSNPSNIKLDLGTENYLAIKNGNIVRAVGQSSALKVSVDQVTENRVSFYTGNAQQTMVLPNNITYYYQGKQTDLTTLSTLLQKSSSIVFNYNEDKNGYSFAVVFDPVYSKPEIADKNFVPSSLKLGSISFAGNPRIVKNGDMIDISQIEYNDVVYQVSDIWGGNSYIYVTDKKVGGKITDILPNRLSPKTLQIGGTNYDFSQDIDINKILSTYGNFDIDNTIVVSLDYDGKIVNVENFGAEDNSGYALVLSTGSTTKANTDGTKTTTNMATLLFTTGLTSTYDVTSANVSQMKGELVTYKFRDDQTVELDNILYNAPGATVINKDQRTVNDSYAADNIKIFNIQFNDEGSDVKAEVLNWSDLPNGTFPAGKILYENTTGAFGDINLMVTNDIFNEGTSCGILESYAAVPSGSGSTNSYTIGIGGKDYKFAQYIQNAATGVVYQFKMNSSGIDSKIQTLSPNATSRNVQAIDSKRIKINDQIYFFDSSVGVYYKDVDGKITSETMADIDSQMTYGKIDLYLNPSNSKVATIVITE